MKRASKDIPREALERLMRQGAILYLEPETNGYYSLGLYSRAAKYLGTPDLGDAQALLSSGKMIQVRPWHYRWKESS